MEQQPNGNATGVVYCWHENHTIKINVSKFDDRRSSSLQTRQCPPEYRGMRVLNACRSCLVPNNMALLFSFRQDIKFMTKRESKKIAMPNLV